MTTAIRIMAKVFHRRPIELQYFFSEEYCIEQVETGGLVLCCLLRKMYY